MHNTVTGDANSAYPSQKLAKHPNSNNHNHDNNGHVVVRNGDVTQPHINQGLVKDRSDGHVVVQNGDVTHAFDDKNNSHADNWPHHNGQLQQNSGSENGVLHGAASSDSDSENISTVCADDADSENIISVRTRMLDLEGQLLSLKSEKESEIEALKSEIIQLKLSVQASKVCVCVCVCVCMYVCMLCMYVCICIYVAESEN
jgi:hypothetical protein